MRFARCLLWLLGFVLACSGSSLMAQEASVDNGDSVQIGKPAPEFMLEAADGQRISLNDLRGEDGKYVVAVFVRAHW